MEVSFFFIIQGGYSFTILISILAMIAYFEFLNMARIPMFSLGSLLGFLFLISQLLPYVIPLTISAEQLITAFVFLLLVLIILSKNRFSIEQAGPIIVRYVIHKFWFFIIHRNQNYPWAGSDVFYFACDLGYGYRSLLYWS